MPRIPPSIRWNFRDAPSSDRSPVLVKELFSVAPSILRVASLCNFIDRPRAVLNVIPSIRVWTTSDLFCACFFFFFSSSSSSSCKYRFRGGNWKVMWRICHLSIYGKMHRTTC